MALNIKTSTTIAFDIGNQEIQGRLVSKTMPFGLFTLNKNAVWAGRQQLMKESYPLAFVSFPANRDIFRLEVGDCFKFSCAKYGIVNMICRVVYMSEEGPESEIINIQAIEDIYSVSNSITEYSPPESRAIPNPDYTIYPFLYQKVIETPYAFSSIVDVLAFACRRTDYDGGFLLYMSIDDGASYTQIGDLDNLVPFGTLTNAYPDTTHAIDEDGFTVDFIDDQEDIEASTWAEILSGTDNLGLLGTEIISFLTPTPVTETQYTLENVIRGRFGTQKQSHAAGETLYIINKALEATIDSEIIPGSTRKFKLVPYNVDQTGDIAEATEITLPITGVAFTPYTPINFAANGSNYASRYDTDIVLTWDPRCRGKGAGIGIPGEVLGDTTRDGYFTIEVWVGGVKKRTTTAIDAVTWTYTQAMNTADNGSLASIVTFKIANYRTDAGVTYTSAQETVVCYKN